MMTSTAAGVSEPLRPPVRSVRFLLSHNRPGSLTRITADTANYFVQQGIPTTILYPSVDWLDYKRFIGARLRGWKRWTWWAKVALGAAWQLLWRRQWGGWRWHQVDPRVRTERYGLTPSATHWRPGDVAVVHPPYLMPHLLRTLPSSDIILISVIHIDLEHALNSPVPNTAAWYRHWVAGERLLSVPRYATCETTRQAAERLGLPCQRAIAESSVDLRQFRPGPARPPHAPLVVTLYCDPNPQKGQRPGVAALRAIRAKYPDVHLRSLGHVLPDATRVFHRHYGYLHRDALVRAFQESDIFVYASLYDSFPAPPLQALACGAALVTTTVSGVLEYALEGDNALLCAPGDAAGLTAQISRLIEDASLRRRLQMQGPRVAAAFSVERSAQALVDFIRELVDDGSVRREATTMVTHE